MGLIGSSDARYLDQLSPRLKEIYDVPPTLVRRDGETGAGARALSEAVFATGRKGLSMQRQGSRRMNASSSGRRRLIRSVVAAGARE